MRKGFFAAAIAFSLLVTGPAWAQDCDHERQIDVSIDAAGADLAEISVGAGSLLIEGSSGTAVTVTGRACASSASWLEEMALRAERDGDRVEIETEVPDDWNWSGNRYAYFDLEIRVPASMMVDAEDGSGNATIRGVGGLEMSDGSGNLDISDIAGDVRVSDGSGNLEIGGVGGHVRISDGSGEMTVRDAGSVTVDSDGSGSIRLESIRGDAVVDSDGSGNIVVEGVGGDFRVDSDGSGSIRYEDVAGTVDIPERKRRR
jgi:hypothetical protein